MSDSPRALLQRHGLRPRHSWGQNFLGDPAVLERLAREALIGPGDTVLELGAGLGHLTEALLATKATVIAVERDRDLARALRERQLSGLQVLEANAAALDFAQASGVEQVVVVGNLPYHLTSPILFELLDQVDHVPRALFTLQQEVVTRLGAGPGSRDYGLLSVLLGLRFEIEPLFGVKAHQFFPPPAVDSAVVRLRRRDAPRAAVADERRFRALVKAGFAHRRKTLANSLKLERATTGNWNLAEALSRAQIDGQRRAETLSIEEFAALERALP